MAPAQLELFKFGLYVFIPIAAMLHYGDPDWYEQYVGPLRSNYRKDDLPQIAPAQTPSELKDQLAKMREERLKKRDERNTSTTTTAPTIANAESPRI
ncbi:BZ3500_MvSof-1268-A1-R1_Chr4-2g06946 [Microbotryum saponariae]|uniref:BZ3500_MvSof-1268-A1-R1_Chr4-2g06946 protein n=1 Tax=Microbotryum saponariae TaxID=289078 RepID=A0A2X0KVE7_9BASI|nr:BZ3500_MvSof-1268-A1-R1_Chr4-2g06946 [Microbotryum saponariae]SDA06611.1 BZ3501_MvSof-1269-A2-R1_Chr4-2g06657 [Microbotryum saponariae]